MKCGMWLTNPYLQAEIIRFEDDVIEGGPLVLPGTLDLLKQVSDQQRRLCIA